jgi:Family of unknown function (DUF6459)
MPTPPPPRAPGSGPHPSDPGRPGCPGRVTRRPLPDPSAVHLRPVPSTAPPYDDELLPPLPATARPAARPAHHPPAADRIAPGGPGPTSPPRATPPPGPAGQPANTRLAFATQFAQVLVESLAGTRPPRQLATWTTERAKSRIQRMAPLLAAGHSPQLRRVLAHHPAPGVIEMTIIIAVGPRTRALAIRLEHTRPPHSRPGRPPQPAKWICTDIEAA